MQKRGFSLMEMMVVMLIVAVIAAATAPMINKKMIQNASGESPWIWTSGMNNSIAFNMRGNSNSPAVIGAVKPPSGLQTRLHINSNDTTPLITFTDSRNNTSNESLRLRYQGVTGAKGLCLNNLGSNIANSVLLGADIDNRTPNTVAVGVGIDSTTNGGSNNVAVGHQAGVVTNSVAVGANSRANTNSIAIGSNVQGSTTTASANSIAMGTNTTSGEGAVAIGVGTTAGTSAVAIGTGTSATTTASANSIAMGTNTTSGEGAVAIGVGTTAGTSAVAIGTGTSATTTAAENSVAIGSGATITDSKSSIAIGPNAGAVGSYHNHESCIAIGNTAKASTYQSMALGFNSNAENAGISIGSGSAGEESFNDNNNRENYKNPPSTEAKINAIALGNSSKASGKNSIAIGGYFHDTSSYVAVATKRYYRTEASGEESMAIGNSAKAKGKRSIAIGSAKAAYANDLMLNTTAYSDDSIAIGTGAATHGTKSVAIGYQAKTTAPNQIVLGKSDTTVYIPGNLVVAGNTLLGNNSGAATYIRPVNRFSSNLIQMYGEYVGQGDLDYAWNMYSSKTASYNKETGVITTTSDRRLKNVGDVFKAGLEEVKKLEVFNYTFKKDPEQTPRVGVMAQDLEKIFPNAVFKGDDGFLRIRMEDMFYAVVNAVKELDAKLTALVEEVKTAIADITDLKIKSAEYEKTIAELVEQNKAQAKALKDLEKRLAKLEKKALKEAKKQAEEVVEEIEE